MAYSTGQLEIPSGKVKKAFAKKGRHKALRMKIKSDTEFTPQYNRYRGYR